MTHRLAQIWAVMAVQKGREETLKYLGVLDQFGAWFNPFEPCEGDAMLKKAIIIKRER